MFAIKISLLLFYIFQITFVAMSKLKKTPLSLYSLYNWLSIVYDPDLIIKQFNTLPGNFISDVIVYM